MYEAASLVIRVLLKLVQIDVRLVLVTVREWLPVEEDRNPRHAGSFGRLHILRVECLSFCNVHFETQRRLVADRLKCESRLGRNLHHGALSRYEGILALD